MGRAVAVDISRNGGGHDYNSSLVKKENHLECFFEEGIWGKRGLQRKWDETLQNGGLEAGAGVSFEV